MDLVEFMKIFPPLSRLETVFLILILIPTLIALLTGAPWVPTPKERVRKMLQLAKLKKGQTVMDLGCGDGRLVHIASAEFGAKGIGLEFSPLIYAMAKMVQPFYWLKGSRAKIKFRNFFNVDLSKADVIVFYLMPHAMRRVRKKCEQELKKGARVISYAFPIKEWEPIHRQQRVRKKGFGPIWVYEMEAQSKRAPNSATSKIQSKKKLAK
jgi:SAM-dependent methyltransferase